MWQSILIVAVPLLDIWTIGRAILRGHGVQGTIAWVMTIIAFPVFGALLYFALASPSVKRLKIRKQRAAQTIRATVGPEPEPAVPLHPLMDLAASLTDMEPTSGNEATLLAENDLAFRAIEEAMEAAEHRIWAEYYMVRNDETGHRFLDILLERARAGVEVLFIHDAVGSAGLDASRLDSIRDAGGQVVAFHPVNPLKHRWSVHLRNHKKLVIVDDTIGFTGGMNVGDEYAGRRRFRGKASFRDTHLMIRGPAVHDLARTFLEDWAFAAQTVLAEPPTAEPIPGATATIAVLPSGPDQEHNASARTIFAAIGLATSKLWITSPYFIPDGPTLWALETTALRGVDVRVLLPEKSDVRLVSAAARSFYKKLMVAGVKIYEYRRSMLHAKTLVMDSRLALVGSANCDFRSFALNFELGALVDSEDFASDLEGRFVADLEESRLVPMEEVLCRSIWGRMIDGCVRLLAPLL